MLRNPVSSSKKGTSKTKPMEFLIFPKPKGIVMAFTPAHAPKDYSLAPMWLNAIRHYGLPRDPESEISSLEGPEFMYVGWDGRVFALNPETGRRVWVSTLRNHGLPAESQLIHFALHQGSLYATWNNRIFRLDPSTGRIQRIQRADAQLAVLLD